jgi:hypothetical protein
LERELGWGAGMAARFAKAPAGILVVVEDSNRISAERECIDDMLSASFFIIDNQGLRQIH